MNDSNINPKIQEVYHNTRILRKPITGIVSGYHELPYILVAPDEENSLKSIEINGKINVSPKFLITPNSVSESFDDVFDIETFDKQLEGRLFSFTYSNKRNIKIKNSDFSIQNFDEKADEHLDKVLDNILKQENLRTSLIFCPVLKFYPVSIDKLIGEIIAREFRV